MPLINLQKNYREIFAKVTRAKELRKIKINDLGDKDFVLPKELLSLRNKIVSESLDLASEEAAHLFDVAVIHKVCEEFNSHASSLVKYREEQLGRFQKLVGDENLKLLIGHGLLSAELIERTKYSYLLNDLPSVDVDLSDLNFVKKRNQVMEPQENGALAKFNVTAILRPYAIFQGDIQDKIVMLGTVTSHIGAATKFITNGTESKRYTDSCPPNKICIALMPPEILNMSSQLIKFDEENDQILIGYARKGFRTTDGNYAKKPSLILSRFGPNGEFVNNVAMLSDVEISVVNSLEVNGQNCFIHHRLDNGVYVSQKFDLVSFRPTTSPAFFTTQPTRQTHPELFGPEVDTTKVTLADGRTVQLSGNSIEIFAPQPTLFPTAQPSTINPTLAPTTLQPSVFPSNPPNIFPSYFPSIAPSNNDQHQSKPPISSDTITGAIIGSLVAIIVLCGGYQAVQFFRKRAAVVVGDSEGDIEQNRKKDGDRRIDQERNKLELEFKLKEQSLKRQIELERFNIKHQLLEHKIAELEKQLAAERQERIESVNKVQIIQRQLAEILLRQQKTKLDEQNKKQQELELEQEKSKQFEQRIQLLESAIGSARKENSELVNKIGVMSENVVMAGEEVRQLKAESKQEKLARLRAEAEELLKDPEDFVDAISQELMTKPTITIAGHSYQEEWIKRSIATRKTDPKTRENLGNQPQLIPDHTLRSAINAFVDNTRERSLQIANQFVELGQTNDAQKMIARIEELNEKFAVNSEFDKKFAETKDSLVRVQQKPSASAGKPRGANIDGKGVTFEKW